MNGTLLYGKAGIESPKSAYQPGESVKILTQTVMEAYSDGRAVLNNPYPEYNGRSFVDQANESQRTWLSHPDAPYVGEDEWRWNGVRPLTRNRIIFTAARLTAQLIVPGVFSQNDMQEEDREAAYAMESMIEYNIRNTNYETAFLFGVISGLVNPINYFSIEYCQSMQKAWQAGQYEDVIDDVLSGFQYSLIPIDEILFSNPYVYEWQEQDWIIRARRVSYEEMEGKFGQHDNWTHVECGKTMALAEDGFWYDTEDINDGMVLHVNYKHRRSDCELDFVNGVYLSNPNTEFNPFYHRRIKTVRGKAIEVPLYNTVKYGFEPIDAMRFVGYKSLADKMSNDQDAADREWQDFFDASRLATFQPILLMGAGKFDKSVVAPSAVTELGPEAKAQPISVSSPAAPLAALREAERSGNESSLDPQAGGVQSGPQKTKYESALLESNTDTNLELSAKLIARMVKEAGGLMIDDIVRYQTIGAAGELVGDMTYKTFILDSRVIEGKKKTTYIRFTDRYAGKSMTQEEKDSENYRLMNEAGDDKELIDVNPGVFARLNWMTTVEAEALTRRNSVFERSFKLAAYDKAMQNPLIQRDPEAQLKITRDFLLEPIMKGDADKYLPNIQKVASTLVPAPAMPGATGNSSPQVPASQTQGAQGLV